MSVAEQKYQAVPCGHCRGENDRGGGNAVAGEPAYISPLAGALCAGGIGRLESFLCREAGATDLWSHRLDRIAAGALRMVRCAPAWQNLNAGR
jgi:hypothetical protein